MADPALTIVKSEPLAIAKSELPPTTGPRMAAPSPDAPVTLGDLLDNPQEAMKRAGHLIGRDLRDPKTWAGLAAAWLGPKLIDAAPGMAGAARSGAATTATAVGNALDNPVVGTVSPRAAQAGKLLRVGGAMLTPKPEPVPSAAPIAAPSVPEPAAPMAPKPAAPAPAPRVASPPVVRPAAEGPTAPRTLNDALREMHGGAASQESPIAAPRPGHDLNTAFEEAIAERATIKAAKSGVPSKSQIAGQIMKAKMSAAELNQGMKWMDAGIDPGTIVDRLLALREAKAGSVFSQLPTTEDVASAVRARNATGRWATGKPTP